MKTPATPGTATQLSARDDQGRWILSVIAKRTYSFRVSGACTVAEEQAPLVAEPVYDAETGNVLEADTDLWPYKPRTDVVVRGHAVNHAGKPSFSIGVRVDKTSKIVRVHGDRRATIGFDGRVLFSKPSPVERLPLSYAFAYGGRDAVSEAEVGNPAWELRPYLPAETTDRDLAAASPFVYPRNPAGCGYVVDGSKEAIEAVRLPNFEDLEDPLTPERFVADEPDRWPLQPVPAGLGWLDYGAFPRMAWFGVVPDHDASIDVRRLGELRLGHVAPDILSSKPPGLSTSLEGVNGASLGLRVPHLRGGEELELLNLNPSLELVRVRLPTERPALWVDARNGKLAPTTPVIHSVVIEPDAYRLTITWRGAAPALRPYSGQELAEMPFAAEW